MFLRPASVVLTNPARVEADLLGSARNGPFPTARVRRVPSYFEDNLVALRHWKPPGAVCR